MRTLSDATLIELYEAGSRQLPPQRALTILVAAYPEEEMVRDGGLTVGQRDARLLDVRQATFGPEMACVTSCPACGEKLEFNLSVPDLLAEPTSSANEGSVDRDGYHAHFRLPTSQDLVELATIALKAGDGNGARQQLLERCLLLVECGGQVVAPQELPEPVLDDVVLRMAQLDPQSDVTLVLNCLACDHGWQTVFDVVAYLWEEIAQRVREIMQQVHLVASAYGWSEADILALSPWRRRAYLELAYG